LAELQRTRTPVEIEMQSMHRAASAVKTGAVLRLLTECTKPSTI
jgi:hypothetical protein